MFSLFGRKSKAEPRRVHDGMPIRIPDSLRGPTTGTTVEMQRELARRTAEKIDQIESEMIDAGGQGGGNAPVTNPAPVTLPMPPRRPPAVQSSPAAGAAPANRQPHGGLPDSYDRAHGAEMHLQAARAPAAPLPPLEFSTSVLLGDTMAGAGGIHVSEANLPPELEEAAILFANAQPQAAVATLRAALRAGTLQERTRQGWLMLLDVLQSIGERAEFESVALEFAARFEQSPPAWQESAVEPVAPRATTAPATVRFGALLDGACARHVEQAQRAGASGKTVTIDLTSLAELDHEGAIMLCALIEDFAVHGRELVVMGAPRLRDIARAAIEPGRRDAGDGGWKLALLALRLLGEKQAFDDLSIDYCVTYEVSPPSWEPMPANVRATGPGTGSDAARAARASAAGAAAARSGQVGESGAFALRGEIAGRMAEELVALRGFAHGRGDLVIDCRALRRLDFVAAGELLNEVVGLVGQGHTVLFAEPSAIVDALLVVMGIHEVAEIRRRRT